MEIAGLSRPAVVTSDGLVCYGSDDKKVVVSQLQFEDGKMIPASKFGKEEETVTVEMTPEEEELREKIRVMSSGLGEGEEEGFGSSVECHWSTAGMCCCLYSHSLFGAASSIQTLWRTLWTSSMLGRAQWMSPGKPVGRGRWGGHPTTWGRGRWGAPNHLGVG